MENYLISVVTERYKTMIKRKEVRDEERVRGKGQRERKIDM